MAENKRPLITADNPPRHINLATIKTQRINGKPMSSNNTSRMDADRLSVLVDTTRMQLISPPPEEMLRPVNPPSHGTTSAAKRKRTQPATTFSTPPLYSRDVNSTSYDNDLGTQSSQQPIEATPNPKPRKQGRLHSRQPSLESPMETSFTRLGSSPVPKDDTAKQHTPTRSKTKRVLFESPHAKNPDADFIDVPALILPARRKNLLSARSSRRSATPIIPYEPPTDVFTPPREVFLSPVTKSMSKSSKRKTVASASGLKSAKGKMKGSALTIVTAVKQELPDIDLTLPMPPPSPTDDPLLLSGPPEFDFLLPEPTPPRRREMSVQVQADDRDLPPSSPELPIAMDDEDVVRVFDRDNNIASAETSTDETFMQLDPDDAGIPPVRLFDTAPDSNGGWSDSEDEPAGGMEGVDEGEGEYTGRWKMMLVRTKQDPPSSATRGRMEEWGRPISPFPKKVAKLAFLEEEEEEEGQQGLNHQQGGKEGEREEVKWMPVEPEQLLENEEAEEQEVRRMSVEPEQLLELNEEAEAEEQEEVRRMSIEPEELLELNEEAEEQEVRRMSVEPEQLLELNEEAEEAEEQEEVRRMSVEPEELLELNEEAEAEEQEEVRRMSVEPEQLSENDDEEEHEVRQISVELEDDEELTNPFDKLDRLPLQYTEKPVCGDQTASCIPCHSEQEEDDDQSSDDSEELSHGIVKITSADPRSAARAAAILKQHDYDCYTNIEIKRRHKEAKHRRKSDIEDSAKESRRRDVFSSGVAKVSNSRRRRRSTLGMGVIGDRVFIPGSPAITLPELLHEAELEVRDSPRSLSQRSLVLPARGDPFRTPIAAKYRVQMAGQKVEVYSGDIGEREWTKEDWKHLDACFTDQRLEVGSRLAGVEQNMLASVDMVSIDDVVDKFVVSKGGFETVASFGALWSRENLLERTRALQKKQRSGRVAPPTTPYTPLSVGSNSNNVLGDKDSRTPCMQIPDFTPLGRRAVLPRKSRPTLPQSVPDQKEPAVIPPTLLAPRYSHLLEEAIAISQEGSTLLPEQETSPQFEVQETSDSTDVPSTTIGKRVKGLLFSYLSTLPKPSSSTVRKAPLSVQPSLPIPPIEILSKPRGPVITPARAPLSKPKHPKELVVLHPAPQPPTISHIPRLKKPQRLVELHPPAPLPVIEPIPIPRPRRSSGSSVKDLVRGFEEIQAVSHDKLKYNVGWKTYTADKKRPHWKP